MTPRIPLRSTLGLMGIALALCTQPASAIVTVSVTPTNQLAPVGTNVTFNAQVATTAGEIITGYTWQMSTNGLNPFTTVSGATTATCVLTNVQLNDQGFYFVKVAYTLGGNPQEPVASPAVTLSVYDQARIVTQPVGGLIRITGSNVSFSVTAGGSPPLTYWWRLNQVPLSNDARISGADSTNLNITALVTADSGSYDIVVSNQYSTATSQVATLSVLIPPGISTQPHDTSVIVGSNALLSVTATGSTPIGYVWWKDGAMLSDDGHISGSNTNKLKIAATTTNDSGSYSVVLSNAVGSITSDVVTLSVLVPPVITSPTNLDTRQGAPDVSYVVTATGTLPITFGASTLPWGLKLDPLSGILSGIPVVTGVFNVTLYATNAAMTSTGQLVITLTTGVPGINSALTATGKQGTSFAYQIGASNTPTYFAASPLPGGLSIDPTTGIISGIPVVSGFYYVNITAGNQFGSDTEILTLNLSSALPVISSSLSSVWLQNYPGYSYRIRASNSPISYGAANLPLGLDVNTTNGMITGTPLEGGTFMVTIWADNVWGSGSNTLVLNLYYATPTGVRIVNVTPTYSSPYLLDFDFSLQDFYGSPIVTSPTNLSVTVMEDGVTNSSASPVLLTSVVGAKQLKTVVTLDYSYGMYAYPGAIDSMEAAANLLISQEPPHALFGLLEFHADFIAPQFVTNSLTSSNNVFVSDKNVLAQTIYGIRTNYVKGNYAGSRLFDALDKAINSFGALNSSTEQRYIVAMTDGNDDSSLINTNSNPLNTVTNLILEANLNHVPIYCIGFGDPNDINTQVLQMLADYTGGQYWPAATTDLTAAFQSIQNDFYGKYHLRWATLKRIDIPAVPGHGFQPSFKIGYAGYLASWNTNLVTNISSFVDFGTSPPTTNYVTNYPWIQFPFNPPDHLGDVQLGKLQLATDPDLGVQAIHLYSFYAPRNVQQMRLFYQANYPCTASLDSTDPGDILYGWTMTNSVDGNGLHTLTMTCADTNNLLTSIPYAAYGNLVQFYFPYPDALTATQAFRIFRVDNTIYNTNAIHGWTNYNYNFTNFITVLAAPPPHGTPIPWLNYYGFKNNYAQAELIATNGLAVWQDYIAGLNPTNKNSHFTLWTAFVSGQTPQVMFSTVNGRNYRLETSTSITGPWDILRDGMAGTGGNILFIDNRPLSSVQAVFYRISVD